MENYEDIINMPHHISKKHPQMKMEARAAQFAPFAALTGYDDEIKETARLTNKRLELTEEMKSELDQKIQMLILNKDNTSNVIITYFKPDDKKQGGKYVKAIGKIKKIDKYNQKIILENLIRIPINDILNIE